MLQRHVVSTESYITRAASTYYNSAGLARYYYVLMALVHAVKLANCVVCDYGFFRLIGLTEGVSILCELCVRFVFLNGFKPYLLVF